MGPLHFSFFSSFNSSTTTSIFQFQSPLAWLQLVPVTTTEAVAISSCCVLCIVRSYFVNVSGDFLIISSQSKAFFSLFYFGIGNSHENSNSKSNSQKLSVNLFEVHKNNNILCCAVRFAIVYHYFNVQHISICFIFSAIAVAAVKRSTQNVRFIQLVVQITIIRLLSLVFNDYKKNVRVFINTQYSHIGRTWCKYLHKIGHTFTERFCSLPSRVAWLRRHKDCFRSTSLYCYRRRHHHRSTAVNLQARAIAHTAFQHSDIFLGSVPTVSNFRCFFY